MLLRSTPRHFSLVARKVETGEEVARAMEHLLHLRILTDLLPMISLLMAHLPMEVAKKEVDSLEALVAFSVARKVATAEEEEAKEVAFLEVFSEARRVAKAMAEAALATEPLLLLQSLLTEVVKQQRLEVRREVASLEDLVAFSAARRAAKTMAVDPAMEHLPSPLMEEASKMTVAFWEALTSNPSWIAN